MSDLLSLKEKLLTDVSTFPFTEFQIALIPIISFFTQVADDPSNRDKNKWTRVPDDYEEIYQQALREMQQPGFEVRWQLFTVWGRSHEA